MKKNTSSFLGLFWNRSAASASPNYCDEEHDSILTAFKEEITQLDFHPRKLIVIQITAHPIFLSNKTAMNTKRKPQLRLHKTENLITQLSLSTFCPVSFNYDTTCGHATTIFEAKSTRLGTESSLVYWLLEVQGKRPYSRESRHTSNI